MKFIIKIHLINIIYSLSYVLRAFLVVYINVYISLNLDIFIYEITFSVQYRYTNNTAGKQIVITMT